MTKKVFDLSTRYFFSVFHHTNVRTKNKKKNKFGQSEIIFHFHCITASIIFLILLTDKKDAE